jgi:predicted Zn-dependent protease
MGEELNRNYGVLKQKADPPPYFMSYEITEEQYHVVSASLGAITSQTGAKTRNLDVSIRVGSPKLDNYHRARGDRAQFTSGAAISIDDDPAAIRRRLWLDTDRAYRAAAERLTKIKTNTQVKVAEEDKSDDFSTEESTMHTASVPKASFDNVRWTERMRKLSAIFKKYPGVLTGSVSVSDQAETKYFASTEGTRLQFGRGFARIVISAQGKAEDGMDLQTFDSFEAVDSSGLPKDELIAAAVERVAQDLTALLKAPEVEPYVGPAIFSGKAAGVFFHEIFGHRIEGHRQKDESEGQTFTKMVGTKVLPEFLTVVFDPTRRKIGKIDLNGWYEYDDEGIKARPVTVVEKGILKTFLLSRSPIQGFDHSNGHGRHQPGLEVVARQSNLIVESTRSVPDARLREMLIEEAKKQNKPYGLYFREVTGGFTNTGRQGLQAFKVMPIVVYRIWTDGRLELVRGADIVGTPLESFSKIVATSDTPDVFNGYCGAESGSVPVSAVAPAILVSAIEIEKRSKSQDRPPLLPMPASESGGAR